MIVNTDQGKSEIKGPVIRTTLGLKSTYFKVREEGSNMVFEGHGWGHGVGMCQYGAMEMARRGASAKRILRHYYQGVWVGQLYE
jgi:stage II sporulation protein D